ncbi:trypsin-like peptidase domain-containing protein [Paracoccus aurantiacus]|uniref:Trypsin-like peptidase domain-containing protein n=1 Tax=Paracoccus aurantiacus TaxID=2599412 RepID=A0A5C6RYM1_9RHOB|nr:serine protease [Paracoccus aurantiacus]TXB66462.1 trypsin-like peptidase domain-containing protein [Paracoccus aurantiacus]
MKVDFFSNWQNEPFSRLDGNPSIHRPQKMLEGWGEADGFEARVGIRNLIDASLLDLLAHYRRAVCRITWRGTNFRGLSGDNSGTGFLVGPNLLLTNNHVLHSAEAATLAKLDFEYERTTEQLLRLEDPAEGPRSELRLAPERLFITSSATDGLDYTFVRLAADAPHGYGFIPMSRGSFTGRPFEPVFLIHHPNGDYKQASVDDTEILNVDVGLLLYAADTETGSSGAPVLTRQGKLCALHHASCDRQQMDLRHAARERQLQDGGDYRVANEGIMISAIANDLERRLGGGGADHTAIREVLTHFRDIDTLVGPYGVRGRLTTVESGYASAGVDTVVRAINATGQDLDIAVWNMEWLHALRHDQATLRRIATVFADMTQDIWIMDSISPESTRQMLASLREQFGQSYECVFAEDEIHPAQPGTAIVYNRETVEVERLVWPDEVAKLWRLRAQQDMALQNLSGPIFPSFPACFRVTALQRSEPASIRLLPLFIGEKINAALRRAVAARVIDRIIEIFGEIVDISEDWLVFGDTNTPLRQSRLLALQDLGFRPIISFDRERGGVTYLVGQRRVLSHLYVPKGMEAVGDDGEYITTVDCAFDGKFIDSLTGTSPFGIRVALLEPAMLSDMDRAERYVRHYSAPHLIAQGDAVAEDWEWHGLGRQGFVTRNRDGLVRVVEQTNAALNAPGDQQLTLLDLVTLIFCEGNFDDGPPSEGGVMPLPQRLSLWLGDAAPAHDARLTALENVALYARYLGQLKNRAARRTGWGSLYRDLFRADGIAGHPARQAALLAGVVQGCFLAENYPSGREPDIAALLDGYRTDQTLQQILRGSGYVHDATGMLQTRQAHIEAAIAAERELSR